MKVIQTKIKTASLHILLDLNSLCVGNVLTFDVFIKKSHDYVVIIEAGTLLSETLYAKLQKQDDLYMLREDKNKLSLKCESLRAYIEYNKDDQKKRIEYIYKVNTKLFDDFLENELNKIDLNCLDLIIESLIYLIKHDDDFLKHTIPYFTHEHNIPNHSLHVSIYALFLGNLLKLSDTELLQLGKAALLQDTGLKKVRIKLINKSTKLDESEIKEFQMHIKYSIEIIQQNNIHDPYIIDAVRHHHEQYDGNGYPNQLQEDEINIFSSILSICDVFDALTSDRPYRKKHSSFDAIKMMLKDTSMAKKFNHQYLLLLLKSL